ncbi:MAG: O-methyltransferase [Ruminococcaceae bacterium]|nr:O-methyltransferase [Oscillospiraceae bacterium]
MIEYDLDAIVHPYITEYLREVIPPKEGILRELEAYAKENSVPIVQPETAQLLTVLTQMIRPRRILEIGCAIGYSAILMSESMAEDGSITTVEWDADMTQIARSNIEKAGLSEKIRVVNQDAKELLPTLTGEYDMIFLDGPKAHYIHMLNDCIRLLRKGGILVADNVLYKGMTADEEHVVRRKITIVKRLRHFIAAQMQRKELKSVLLPVGDGVTVAVRM